MVSRTLLSLLYFFTKPIVPADFHNEINPLKNHDYHYIHCEFSPDAELSVFSSTGFSWLEIWDDFASWVLGFIASEFILVIFGFEADMAGFMFERAWFSLRITLNTPFLYKQRKSCNLQQLQWRVTMFGDPHAWGPPPGKNDHKIFASTLGKLARASVMEGQKICNGWPPNAGIGEIVKFGRPFLVDMDDSRITM